MNPDTTARPAPAGADLRDRIAEVLYEDPGMTGETGIDVARRMQAARRADVAMTEVAPVLAARDARIAALEQRLEDLAADLAAATHFLVGAYRVGRRHDHWEVWADPSRIGLVAGRDGDPIACPTREEALATARRLTAEETDRG